MKEELSILYLLVDIALWVLVPIILMVATWLLFERYRKAVGIALIATLVLGYCLQIQWWQPENAWYFGPMILGMPLVSFLAWILLQELRIIPSVHDRHHASKDAGKYPAS